MRSRSVGEGGGYKGWVEAWKGIRSASWCCMTGLVVKNGRYEGMARIGYMPDQRVLLPDGADCT